MLSMPAQDFGGFRTVLLIPRFRPAWPPPEAFERECPKRAASLGAPRCPLPQLLPKGKPVCAATVRLGPGFMEVPFFATQETHRWANAPSHTLPFVIRCLTCIVAAHWQMR